MTITAIRVEDGSPITLDPTYFGDNAGWRALCAEVEERVAREGIWFGEYGWKVWRVWGPEATTPEYRAAGPEA